MEHNRPTNEGPVIDPEYMESGSVIELVPDQAGWPHRLYTKERGKIGCWCAPAIFVYSDEGDELGYWIVEHNWIQ